MSVQQCEECRLALVRTVFDPVVGESDSWACQLDDTFSAQTRDVECPFYVDWTTKLPPPARSCKKSLGEIDGCSTKSTKSGGCGSCSTSGGCGSGGCGVGDPADALDAKWDPEEAYVADEVAEAALQAQADYFRAAAAAHGEGDHDDHDDHDHGREQVGEGPTEGDTRHRPGPEVMEPRPISPSPEAPRIEPAPGVEGDPSVPDGHAPDAADDGFPTEPARQAAAACGAMKALERMGLGRDEDAPVPVPLDDE